MRSHLFKVRPHKQKKNFLDEKCGAPAHLHCAPAHLHCAPATISSGIFSENSESFVRPYLLQVRPHKGNIFRKKIWCARTCTWCARTKFPGNFQKKKNRRFGAPAPSQGAPAPNALKVLKIDWCARTRERCARTKPAGQHYFWASLSSFPHIFKLSLTLTHFLSLPPL